MSALLRRVGLILSLIIGFMTVLNACPSQAANWQAKGIADGAGVWVNMWNYPADADAYCLKLYSNGIRNIFIQTSRSNTPAICNPEGLSRLLNAAHRYQMRVIAWSFNELINPVADANKIVAAANFQNEEGQRIDAVAANMEKDLSPSKINILCEKVKLELGPSYPLIAVIYSPLNKASVVATIPWPLLAQHFSVLAVMSYWNSKYIVTSGAYQYTLSTIKRIRELSGRPDLDIHIVGDGMGTSPESVSQFLLACKKGAATSASLYPNQQVTTQQLSALAHYPEFFPSNGRFRLASFKELTKNGRLTLPPGEDPSNSISRGHFYQLLVRQFYPSHNLSNQYIDDNKSNLVEIATRDDSKSLAILANAGLTNVLPPTGTEMKTFLSNPLTSKEAFDIVAKVIEIRSQAKSGKLIGQSKALVSRTTKQAKQLFVQPAYAESIDDASTLSYLDAAHIVLLASGGAK